MRPRSYNGNGYKQYKTTDPSAYNGHVGRPIVYNSMTLPGAAYRLCRKADLTNEDLATAFRIDIATLDGWIRTYPEFSKAIRTARDEYGIEKVEVSLFRKATGYEFLEKTHEAQWNPNTQQYEMAVTKIVERHQPASDTSIIFYLSNRTRETGRWKRDNSNADGIGVEGGTNITVQVGIQFVGSNGDRPKVIEHDPSR